MAEETPGLACVRQWPAPGVLLTKENAPNPAWRSFRAPMNHVTAQQTVNRLSTLFRWLSEAGHLRGNPWKLPDKITQNTRVSQVGDDTKPDRELPSACIEAIRHYLDYGARFEVSWSQTERVLPKLSPRVFARRRWLFYFYFLTAARVSSGCNATLDDIYRHKQHQVMLSLHVKGRGPKRHSVPWVAELQDEYYRYRAAMDLPAEPVRPRSKPPKMDEPVRHDLGPRFLFLPIKLTGFHKNPHPLSYETVYKEINGLFEDVSRWVARHPELGLSDDEEAILASASGHWIRHGTAALLGDYAREQLGHRYESTTQGYQVAKTTALVARLQRLGDTAVDDDALYALLEAPEQDRMNWLLILAESIIESNKVDSESRKQEILTRVRNL